MRSILKGMAALLGVIGASSTAEAQTLRMMKSLDAPHYDGQRTTWSPTSDIVNMVQDTLVALDWDGKTALPYLAKSWTVSADGKLYTFKLRDDVSFCSGKKFTAEDVIYSFKRLKDPETRRRYAWRAGNIKELRAPDPYTLEYELAEPYRRAPAAAHHVHQHIHNKESVEALGKDYGIKGIDGTGPWCFVSLAAAHRDRAQAARRLPLGPLDVSEQGAGEVREARRSRSCRKIRAASPPCWAASSTSPTSSRCNSSQQAQERADAHGAGGQAELPAALLRLQDHAGPWCPTSACARR